MELCACLAKKRGLTIEFRDDLCYVSSWTVLWDTRTRSFLDAKKPTVDRSSASEHVCISTGHLGQPCEEGATLGRGWPVICNKVWIVFNRYPF